MLGLAQKESMTAKQRVMHIFQEEMPDRVPINYMYIPDIAPSSEIFECSQSIQRAGDVTNLWLQQLVVCKIYPSRTSGGGYCLAPTHRLHDNTPVENALAMYTATH